MKKSKYGESGYVRKGVRNYANAREASGIGEGNAGEPARGSIRKTARKKARS
jgi:hypothetical protein